MTVSAQKICSDFVGLLPEDSTVGFIRVIAKPMNQNLINFDVDARSVEPNESRVNVTPDVLHLIDQYYHDSKNANQEWSDIVISVAYDEDKWAFMVKVYG